MITEQQNIADKAPSRYRVRSESIWRDFHSEGFSQRLALNAELRQRDQAAYQPPVNTLGKDAIFFAVVFMLSFAIAFGFGWSQIV